MTRIWGLIRFVPSWAWALLIGVLIFLPAVDLSYPLVRQIQLACILALLTSGLNLSLGYAGELALGQAAMYAAGAYTAGLLAKAGTTDVLVQLAAGGAVALAVGVLTGIPGLRLGSWSLAMTSFFLVLLIPDVIAMTSEWTGGRVGLVGIPQGTLFGQPLTDGLLYHLIIVVTVVWFVIARNIALSRAGIALRVLKQSPVLASSTGTSVFRMKVTAYAVGSVPAGLAGVLFTNIDLYLSPETFGFVLATTVLAASILGGSASVYGAAVGAAVMQFGPNQSSDFREYALVFTGVFLLLGGVVIRGGIAELGRAALRRADRRFGHAPRTGLEKAAGSVAEFGFDGRELAVHQVSKAFGGNRALDRVDLRARPGEVTALIGPNGSGKTTLLNLMCGYYSLDGGSIAIGAEEIHRRKSHQIARAGVARTFQTPNVPEGLTVAEVVAAGRYAADSTSLLDVVLRTPRYRRVHRADAAATAAALEMVGMTELAGVEAASLPLGKRRLLEVARALVSRPSVVLLDEAASGLDEDEIEALAQVVRTICTHGATVVLVEHNFKLVLELADHIFVLAQGKVLASGPPSVIESDPRVLDEYLGLPPDETEGLPAAEVGTSS